MNGTARLESGRARATDALFLCVCVVAALLPFVGKAVHMDDPLFVWAARHLVAEPLAPYGFEVNWYGLAMPMKEVAMNPPLFSYLLAAAGALGGWSEAALHLAAMPAAVAVVLGTWQLARSRCADARFAALLSLATPALLVSATTLMCDMLMLAFWVWSVVAWEAGLRSGSVLALAAGLALAALAFATKYFGLALLPLLLIHTVCGTTAHRWRGVVVLVVALFAAGLVLRFGDGAGGDTHVLGAMRYALERTGLDAQRIVEGGVTGLGFAGAGSLALIPLVLLGARGAPVLAGLAVLAIALAWLLLPDDAALDGYRIQQAVHVAGGIAMLAALPLAIGRKDAGLDLLLPAWIAGTMLFACWVNWTVNLRAILPMVPAWSILLVSLLERGGRRISAGGQALALLPMLAIAGWVSVADYQLAGTARSAARELAARHGGDGTLWFQGHWGAQYYLEQAGALPIDFSASRLRAGDRLIVPLNNTNLQPLPAGHAQALEMAEYPLGFMATMSTESRAGLYASVWGPLPYVIGRAPPERYLTLEVTRDLQFGARPRD